MNSPGLMEYKNLNVEFIHLEGLMLFGMQMAMINLSLMDFWVHVCIDGFSRKVLCYGFAAVIMISSPQLIFS